MPGGVEANQIKDKAHQVMMQLIGVAEYVKKHEDVLCKDSVGLITSEGFHDAARQQGQ